MKKRYVWDIVKFIGKMSCNIEIIKGDGQIQEIFFIKPTKCMFILETTQAKIWKDIDVLNEETKYNQYCEYI
jgi:hypothetical protein